MSERRAMHTCFNYFTASTYLHGLKDDALWALSVMHAAINMVPMQGEWTHKIFSMLKRCVLLTQLIPLLSKNYVRATRLQEEVQDQDVSSTSEPFEQLLAQLQDMRQQRAVITDKEAVSTSD